MPRISIKTAQHVVPMIYAYSTPEIARHDGWLKIGYTEQGVDKRIDQQGHEVDVIKEEVWRGNAIFDDGSGETFRDTDFHSYLKRNGVKQPMDLNDPHFDKNDRNEWFRTTGSESRNMFFLFKSKQDLEESNKDAIPYVLRDEQKEAVREAAAYFNDHPGKEFLWNAKPRFGKTLSVYDFCKQIDASKVLILTNRPAIANSWYSDFMRFLYYSYDGTA